METLCGLHILRYLLSGPLHKGFLMPDLIHRLFKFHQLSYQHPFSAPGSNPRCHVAFSWYGSFTMEQLLSLS